MEPAPRAVSQIRPHMILKLEVRLLERYAVRALVANLTVVQLVKKLHVLCDCEAIANLRFRHGTK
jgi:hypothetical protein